MSVQAQMRHIRIGEAFTFPDMPSVVWVKCRGGYRLGRGGQLHACSPSVMVIRYGVQS